MPGLYFVPIHKRWSAKFTYYLLFIETCQGLFFVPYFVANHMRYLLNTKMPISWMSKGKLGLSAGVKELLKYFFDLVMITK